MFFRKKDNRIDWPYLVFIPIALGIILATLILVLKVLKLSNMRMRVSNSEGFKIEAEAMQKKVAEDYVKKLQSLAYEVFQAKDFTDGFAKAESAFFGIRVPQEHLDQHLKAWLAISGLKDANQDIGELRKTIDKLIEEVKK